MGVLGKRRGVNAHIKRVIKVCCALVCLAVLKSSSLLLASHSALEPPSLTRSGTLYGGWWYNAALIQPGAVVYSFGLGEDTSWDEALLMRGVDVYGFDPTPKSSVYVANRAELKGKWGTFHYTAEGLSTRKYMAIFTKPANPDHVSMREGNLSGLGSTIEVPVNTLYNFMEKNGHKHLDILKLDIEGTEYEVLKDLTARNFLPFKQLLVEFHQRFDSHSTRIHEATINDLLGKGFVVTRNESNQEISFERRHTK